MGIGDWGLGPIPNPQSPIPIYINIKILFFLNLFINRVQINNLKRLNK